MELRYLALQVNLFDCLIKTFRSADK